MFENGEPTLSIPPWYNQRLPTAAFLLGLFAIACSGDQAPDAPAMGPSSSAAAQAGATATAGSDTLGAPEAGGSQGAQGAAPSSTGGITGGGANGVAMGGDGGLAASAGTPGTNDGGESGDMMGGQAGGEPIAGQPSAGENAGGAEAGGVGAGGSAGLAAGGAGLGGAGAGAEAGGTAGLAAGGEGGGGAAAGGAGGAQAQDGWIDLFNGVDFDGWVAHDGGRGDQNSLPIDQVFQVEDGEIHVYKGAPNGSAQVFGNLRNETVLSGNYVLHVEYRWGENKFAPRENSDRDAGILYHITGSDVTKVFPDSLEMQIGDSQVGGDYMTGDLWVLGVPTVAEVMVDGELTKVGDVGGDSVPHYSSVHAENPHGEWNECEITVNGADMSVYMLNGVEVNRVYNFTYNGQPLSEGYVSVQAEWAEVFYRNIRYRQL